MNLPSNISDNSFNFALENQLALGNTGSSESGDAIMFQNMLQNNIAGGFSQSMSMQNQDDDEDEDNE